MLYFDDYKRDTFLSCTDPSKKLLKEGAIPCLNLPVKPFESTENTPLRSQSSIEKRDQARSCDSVYSHVELSFEKIFDKKWKCHIWNFWWPMHPMKTPSCYDIVGWSGRGAKFKIEFKMQPKQSGTAREALPDHLCFHMTMITSSNFLIKGKKKLYRYFCRISKSAHAHINKFIGIHLSIYCSCWVFFLIRNFGKIGIF